MTPGLSPVASSFARGMAIIILLLAGLRLFMIHQMELFPDEALYHFLAIYDPLNFCPHPPGTPLLTRFGTLLFGKTELGARLGSFIIAMLTIIPVYRLALKIGGAAAARWAAIGYACTPIYVAFGVITTPDGTQLFAYATALLFTWNALSTGKTRWWLGAGLVVGLSLYIKYIIILYFPSLISLLLWSPTARRHLRRPGPYLAAATAFLVFVPLFLWSEYRDDWSAIRYHLANRQTFLPPTLESVGVYQLLHIAYYSPILYGLYLFAMGRMTINSLRTRNETATFLACFSVLPWLFFAAIAAVTERELSREQWDAMAYVPALVAAAVHLSQKLQQAKSYHWPRLYKWAPAVGAFMLIVVAIEAGSGALSGAVNRKLLFGNLVGWSQMAARADQHLNELPAGPPKYLVGTSFAPALQYAFYSPKPYPLIALGSRKNEKYGLVEVMENSKANLWELLRQPGSSGIFVMDEKSYDSSRSRVSERESDLNRLYESVTPLPVLEIKRKGRIVKIFRFYRCIGLRKFNYLPV